MLILQKLHARRRHRQFRREQRQLILAAKSPPFAQFSEDILSEYLEDQGSRFSAKELRDMYKQSRDQHYAGVVAEECKLSVEEAGKLVSEAMLRRDEGKPKTAKIRKLRKN